jgi:hypothetical protein
VRQKNMSRIISFAAKDVGVSEDFAWCVGFARGGVDEATDDGLMLQRAIDEQDGSEIYAEIPIQRHACYDGIETAVLTRDTFRVTFAPDAVEKMGGIAAMKISFVSSEAEFEKLATMLKRIFRDHAAFSVEQG